MKCPGVTMILVNEGVDKKVFEGGLKEWRRRRVADEAK